MKEKPWFLYILECEGDRLYTGITVNIDARYAAHVSGKGAKFTKSFPPRQILFQAEFPDRGAASRAESDLKKLSATEKRRFVQINTQSGKHHS
ncbi:GIY-YIG nuclease family protein [Parvibaculaceae bacterium PLY_AMNH_Bact1]|nr:GIY-YIG nuclease family protein [Parvibaculaceae bacterium PLY_AMNH_Bact1]